MYAAVGPDGEPVALKVLQGYTPAALYRLKIEFRALAGVVHPNLVPLHKLVIHGGQAFLTMELIDGVDFLRHVRGESGKHADIPKLRAALAQLVAGISALHAAGKLHRDIKPSNVLVTKEGRVAVLDFGLVHDLADDQSISRSYETVVGTPAYMAPELATGLQPRPASDWYSVGVMLYEALVGELPFTGSGLEVLCAKCREDPLRPRERDPSIPEDLDALCTRLLERSPERRPDHLELLARVGSGSSPRRGAADERGARRVFTGGRVRDATRLFGRAKQLQALERALNEVRPRHPVLVRVRGPSGTGKTALVQAFLERVVTLGRGKVVAGRCYASESVPFKAFDSLVDGLMELLLEQRAQQRSLDGLLPVDVGALARVFPVLAHVPEVARLVEAAPEPADGQRGLRAAYSALRGLLTRIVARWPLVLFIDDLQWGDSDSTALMSELLRGPDAPGVLFITGYRADEAVSRTEGAEAREVGLGEDGPEMREIELGPLSLEDAEAMARAEFATLAGERHGERSADARYDLRMGDARVIARESGGSPLLVQELCQHVHGRAARGGVGLESARAVSLEQVVSERIMCLPSHARRVMEVIAVAGRPINEGSALRVANCGARGRAGLGILYSEHLVRRRSGGAVEVFHDTMREQILVLTRRDPKRLRALHLGLATELERGEDDLPELLAVHLRAGGATARAAGYAVQAAEAAAVSLAFNRAAELYAVAIEMTAATDEGARRRLRVAMADALVNGGRSQEAAQLYLEASEDADEELALGLRRRAAVQLIQGGAFHHGHAVLARVLEDCGAPLPRSSGQLLARLTLERARARLRGLEFHPRGADAVSAARLSRLDTLHAARGGLILLDPLRAMVYQARHLREALDLGEPGRVAVALAMEAAFVALLGTVTRRRVEYLLRLSVEVSNRYEAPESRIYSSLIRGLADFTGGRWLECVERLGAARGLLDSGRTRYGFEGTLRELFELAALYQLGRVTELRARKLEYVHDARERGDLCAETSLRAGDAAITWLAADDPRGARQDIHEAVRSWPREMFLAQRAWAFLAERAIDLYEGDGDYAWHRVEETWPRVRSSFLFLGQHVRVMSRFWRANAALLAAADPSRRVRMLAVARRHTRQIAAEDGPHAAPLAALLRGGIAAAGGHVERAAADFKAAERGFEAAKMALLLAATRHRLGKLIGGARGRALVAAAARYMSEEGIAAPSKMAGMYAPVWR